MRFKKFSALVLTAVMVSGMFGIGQVQASETKDWAKIYLKTLKTMDKNDKKISYDLIYVDNDDIPELVVGMNSYWVSVYTIYKGKAVPALDHLGYGAMGNAGYSYIAKKNVIYNSNSDFAGAEYYQFYGKISKGKLVNRNKKELCIKHYKDRNGNGMPDQNEYVDNPLYYYGKKQVSKATFDKYTVSGTKKYIQGKLTYSQIFKKIKKAAK